MSLNTSAPSYTSGQILTAALLNALQDGIQAPWTPYAPTWSATSTNPVLNNATVAGGYLQIGKTVLFRLSFIAGSTTTFGTGAYLFSLPPITISASYTFWTAIGVGTMLDSSASNRYGFTAAYAGGGNVSLFDGSANRVGVATPVAPAVGDQWTVLGLYEAA